MKDFWDYCEERQREERIIAEMKLRVEKSVPLEKVCGKIYTREVYKSEVYSEVKEVELCRIWKRKQRCNYPLCLI